MKIILKITIALAFLIILSSCWGDKTKPNYQYMPDMYKSVGYETYTQNPNYANGMTTQIPVEGTIARGQVPYDFENTNEGYKFLEFIRGSAYSTPTKAKIHSLIFIK